MAKQKHQPEAFDVAEFLRPTDDDLKSALTSLLRDGNAFSSQSESEEIHLVPESVPRSISSDNSQPDSSPVPVEVDHVLEFKSQSSSVVDNTSVLTPDLSSNEPSPINTKSIMKPHKGLIIPDDRGFDLESCLRRAKAAYRLNSTELILYKMFLNWSHVLGKTSCEATNRKICEASGLIEKTVRRNLKSLRTRGLIIQVKAYDPYTHEPALFDVSLPPNISSPSL